MTEQSRFESRADFARRLNCKRSYVTALAAAGRLVLDESGAQVDWQASMERIEATRDPSKAATVARHAAARTQTAPVVPDEAQDAPESPDRGSAGNQTEGYQKARAMRETYAAMSARLEYERAIGKVVVVADVRAAIAASDALIRQRLEAMPDIEAPQIAALGGQEHAIRLHLSEAIERILADLSRSIELGENANAS